MKNKPLYVEETDEYLVNGRVVKASTLTESEKKKIRKSAKVCTMIINENDQEGNLING